MKAYSLSKNIFSFIIKVFIVIYLMAKDVNCNFIFSYEIDWQPGR